MASPIVTNTSAQLNGASLVYGFATVLTDAQIKALPTTPVTLVAAPASGTRIKLIGASANLITLAGYTNINTTYCAVTIGNIGGAWAAVVALNDSTLATPLTVATSFFGGIVNAVWDPPMMATPVDAGASSGLGDWFLQTANVASTDWAAKAMLISTDNNGSGVWTGGNASNSLRVTLYYAVETLS